MDYLKDLGADWDTILIAICDENLEQSYKLIKENPKISKAEFLEKIQITEGKASREFSSPEEAKESGNVSEEKLRLFVKVLCSMRLTEDTIHGVVAMMGDDLQAMDELVQYIKENPGATEAEVTKAASRIMGVSPVK